MEVIGLLSGGAPVIKKYQVNATFGNAGVPALIGASNEAGLDLPTTTAAADVVGITLDTATYTTTQGTGSSSAERLVSVIINPDAIIRARMSGGSTEGTALTQYTVTTADSDGVQVITGDDWSSPETDEGVVWGYSGSNVGQIRKVTSTATTYGQVTVPFDYNPAVGDVYLKAPYWPMQCVTVQLTDAFYEADASIAVGTGANFAPIDLECNDISNDGTTKSYVHMLARDHFLGRNDS